MAEINFEYRAPTDKERDITTGSLKAHTEQAIGIAITHEPFGLMAYENGKLAGSIIGKIFFNWLHMDLVWVDEPYQRSGIGTHLMKLAAKIASEKKLSGIEVWTQSWQAPEFYKKLGYEEFAVLDDFTPGRKRYAFRYYL
jgi:ribosomal protein S18 acetylase RimI-like enzyme